MHEIIIIRKPKMKLMISSQKNCRLVSPKCCACKENSNKMLGKQQEVQTNARAQTLAK